MSLSAEQKALKPKLAEANINPESFLATDYLNHFNEIVMILEMVPEMPTMVEDAQDWQPASYPDHFHQSGFAGKEIAIQAYALAPAEIRDAFEKVVEDLDRVVLSTLSALNTVGAMDRDFSPAAAEFLKRRTNEMQDGLAKLNQIIHTKVEENVDDAQTVERAGDQDDSENVQTQEEIDALFD